MFSNPVYVGRSVADGGLDTSIGRAMAGAIVGNSVGDVAGPHHESVKFVLVMLQDLPSVFAVGLSLGRGVVDAVDEPLSDVAFVDDDAGPPSVVFF